MVRVDSGEEREKSDTNRRQAGTSGCAAIQERQNLGGGKEHRSRQVLENLAEKNEKLYNARITRERKRGKILVLISDRQGGRKRTFRQEEESYGTFSCGALQRKRSNNENLNHHALTFPHSGHKLEQESQISSIVASANQYAIPEFLTMQLCAFG